MPYKYYSTPDYSVNTKSGTRKGDKLKSCANVVYFLLNRRSPCPRARHRGPLLHMGSRSGTLAHSSAIATKLWLHLRARRDRE